MMAKPIIEPTRFLESIAQEALQQYGKDLSGLTLVFPNLRSATLFSRHLSKMAQSPVWSPELLSISGFVHQHTHLLVPDPLTLISELHQCWNSLPGNSESFGKFYFWGELILKDFNEIDRWMGNATDIFRSIKDQKELDERFGELDEGELAALRSFWGTLSGGSKNSPEKKSFLKLWESLFDLYQLFRNRLLSAQTAYEGMVYRTVAESLAQHSLSKGAIWFCGFNLLSISEEEIIRYYIQHKGARALWDVDAWYMDNKAQEAGRQLRKYQQDPVFAPGFPARFSENIIQKPEIIQHPLPSRTEQCLEAARLVHHYLTVDHIPEEEIGIVLPSDDLLFPLLNALPKEVQKINVTMGYPLKHTPWFSLVEYLAQLQENISTREEETEFWYLPVMALLRHPLLADPASLKTAAQLQQLNRVYISVADLLPVMESEAHEKWALIFKVVHEKEFPELLLNIIRLLTETAESPNETYDLNQDFSYQLYAQVNRLNDLVQQQQTDPGEGGWLPLIRQILRQVKLPFSGEPLEGIQIMGVLESRNLDYEKVIILSMEEGHFPPASENNSFIPFNIRKAFRLPLPDIQDAAYAYYFYRLLHHASEVHLFFTPAAEGIQSGEKSRFILQVENELTQRPITSLSARTAAESVPVSPPEFNFHKHPELAGALKKRLESGISPSSLNTLMDCSLKFAYQYLLRLQEPKEITEEIDPAQFGTVLHKCMELLYGKIKRNKKGRIPLNPEKIKSLEEELDSCLTEAFQLTIFEGRKPKWEGRNVIVRNVLEKYVRGILEVDSRYEPFEIIQSEQEVTASLPVSMPVLSAQKTRVKLRGYIDRVDETDDSIRIIDYKTGKDQKDFTTVEDLFNPDSGKANKAALQTLLYGWMWLEQHPEYKNESKSIQSGLYLMREIYNPEFRFELSYKPDGKTKTRISDIRELLPEIESRLMETLEKLGSADFTFTATDDLQKCAWCPYAGICGRG